jgi:hypothetical protein
MLPTVKKIAGILLLLTGLLFLITPFTPGSWIFFILAELLGVRLTLWRQVKDWWRDRSRSWRKH